MDGHDDPNQIFSLNETDAYQQHIIDPMEQLSSLHENLKKSLLNTLTEDKSSKVDNNELDEVYLANSEIIEMERKHSEMELKLKKVRKSLNTLMEDLEDRVLEGKE